MLDKFALRRIALGGGLGCAYAGYMSVLLWWLPALVVVVAAWWWLRSTARRSDTDLRALEDIVRGDR